jgi:GAF domain-containing protein
MKSQTVTIYTLNKYKSYLRLVARSSRSQFDVAKSIKVEHAPYVQKVLNEKKLFINKELIGDTPLLSAPVLSNGEVIAIISLHDMKFDNFTLYYQNLFNITVDLISSALSRALSYVEATGNQRYIEGTPILISEVFADILASKKISNSKHGVEFVLLATDANDTSPEELSHLIARSLRETDYIGMSENDQLLVLLANSSLEEADFVISRFQQNGISLHVVKEDFSYV